MKQQQIFLPFTPAGKATELQAIKVKRLLGVDTYGSLDPYAALARIPGRIVDEETLAQLPISVQESLCSDEISAIGYGILPSTREWLILVNPTQAPTRRKVSLMEELVHITLKHPKTELTFRGDGTVRWKRPYDRQVEDEAFCVGAACIIPYKALFYAIKSDSLDITALAERFGVSQECAEYRIKRAGLWRVYNSRSVA